MRARPNRRVGPRNSKSHRYPSLQGYSCRPNRWYTPRSHPRRKCRRRRSPHPMGQDCNRNPRRNTLPWRSPWLLRTTLQGTSNFRLPPWPYRRSCRPSGPCSPPPLGMRCSCLHSSQKRRHQSCSKRNRRRSNRYLQLDLHSKSPRRCTRWAIRLSFRTRAKPGRAVRSQESTNSPVQCTSRHQLWLTPHSYRR